MPWKSLADPFRRLVLVVVMACVMTAPAAAQLTKEQKVHDFENLAALYAKRYAPYEWKKELFGFDLFDLRPWLRQIRQSPDDLAFFEILLKYKSRAFRIRTVPSPCRPAFERTSDSRSRGDRFDQPHPPAAGAVSV